MQAAGMHALLGSWEGDGICLAWALAPLLGDELEVSSLVFTEFALLRVQTPHLGWHYLEMYQIELSYSLSSLCSWDGWTVLEAASWPLLSGKAAWIPTLRNYDHDNLSACSLGMKQEMQGTVLAVEPEQRVQ